MNLTVSPAGAGTVTGGGQYDSGASVNIGATPASGYHFVRWSDNSTNDTPHILNVLESDIDLMAIFEADVPEGGGGNEDDEDNPGRNEPAPYLSIGLRSECVRLTSEAFKKRSL